MKGRSQIKNLFIDTCELSNVVLNWYGESIEKLGLYSEAYHSAAPSLLKDLSDEQLRDISACPVVFLYRMCLELSLKSILVSGSRILRLQGEPFSTTEKILAKGHNLFELLKELRALYEQLGWAWDSEHDEIGGTINEFNKNDPGSFCFRYPVNMRGENALDRDFRFDLSNFSTRMDGVLTFLDHVDCGVMGVLDETQQVNS